MSWIVHHGHPESHGLGNDVMDCASFLFYMDFVAFAVAYGLRLALEVLRLL